MILCNVTLFLPIFSNIPKACPSLIVYLTFIELLHKLQNHFCYKKNVKKLFLYVIKLRYQLVIARYPWLFAYWAALNFDNNSLTLVFSFLLDSLLYHTHQTIHIIVWRKTILRFWKKIINIENVQKRFNYYDYFFKFELEPVPPEYQKEEGLS